MNRKTKTRQQLLLELDDLSNRLSETEETLDAIRTGAVDAVVVSDNNVERIFTLQSADYTYRVMAENMNEGAVILNGKGVTVFANKAFADLAGKEMSVLVGTRLSDSVTGSPRKGLSAFLKQCMRHPSRSHFIISGPQDGTIPVSISGTAFNISGRRNICLIVSDLRERREAERKLRTAYEEVEKIVVERTQELKRNVSQLSAANKELGSFNLSVSHDLRNPLHAITSCISVLSESRSAMDKDACKAVDYIEQMTDRMSQVLKDLLSLSHISRKPMKRSAVSLSGLAQGLMEDISSSDPRSGTEVVIMPGITAGADEGLAGILLENLLRNAWKFSSGRTDARIEFGAARTKGQKVFFVRDNGVGFDMASAGLLFEPFTRLHSREEFPGSGIGLSIVKRIVQRHGGAIWAKSESGKGATFYFTLSSDVP